MREKDGSEKIMTSEPRTAGGTACERSDLAMVAKEGGVEQRNTRRKRRKGAITR